MKILTINSGSTSIKFKLYDMPQESVLAEGKVEDIGSGSATLTYRGLGPEIKDSGLDIKNHHRGLNLVISRLMDSKVGVIRQKKDIEGIGHRVVNIGDRVSKHSLIDKTILGYLEACIELAPLHNPPNLLGVKVSLDEFGKDTPNVAVFDNMFHQAMPPKAYLYGLPYKYYQKYRIRKYGFHGIAYTYMVNRASQMAGMDKDSLKIIAMMLGGGSSVTAFMDGKSIDTSMGFTPTEGLMMSTRSGDIDPAILPYLEKKEGLGPEQIDDIINKESGILGLSGKYSSFLDIEKGIEENDNDCIRAFDSYVYRIKKYIGSYVAAMGGVDLVVLGGGIGENSWMARENIFEQMECFGLVLDKDKNRDNSIGERFISSDDSKVKIAVVDVDEEIVIARESFEIIKAL